jgi:hypothetical protein
MNTIPPDQGPGQRRVEHVGVVGERDRYRPAVAHRATAPRDAGVVPVADRAARRQQHAAR